MESKKINQLATELTPTLDDLTIIGDPTTGISKKITLSQMASLFTGTVEEYANLAAFPLVGTADTIYIALDTNIIYRWNTGTSAYVELSPNIVTSLVFSDANGFDGNISLVGSTATLTITTALTTGSVPFIGASGALSQDNTNLFFDDTNNRLGINTNTPTTALDVFGSGIIGRLNGTSTNNAFLGFASAGSNKWSIGNVQSDHRFRIYSEANTAELVSVLQTGEFGIGIANPLTKLHIFGGASALIANLDANTSVAKSISFRSGNSSRINLEVSGTESGSNAGADLFVRTYTDAGALLATPLTITRSTGAITLTGALSGTTATFSSDVTLTKLTSATGLEYQVRNTNGASGNHVFKSFNTTILTLDGGTNAATFSNIVGINGASEAGWSLKSNGNLKIEGGSGTTILQINDTATNGRTWSLISSGNGNVHSVPAGSFYLRNSTDGRTTLQIASTGAATFNIPRTSGTNVDIMTLSDNVTGVQTSGFGVRILATSNNGQAKSAIAFEADGGTNNDTAIAFYTQFSAASLDRRMTINRNGDVGIGIAGPYGRFHVAGGDMYIGLYHATNKLCLGGDANQYIRYASFDGLEISGYQGVRFTYFGGTEAMRITANGHVWIGQTSSSDPVSLNISGIAFEGTLGSGKFSRSGNAALDVNRVTNDGELQRFYQDGLQEGSISVSGATVSYNSFLGSHWSQLKDNSRPEILKGTILEVIDELCVWENESNDRLPKSKISDIIESKNVYGTFFDWDNDWKGSNDFYVSSVGLGFIRVNGNETIEIGDLLQSNGDGTAKVQSDDILRSSTIAKVVSTNKIETYEDKSYLIAATLHCG